MNASAEVRPPAWRLPTNLLRKYPSVAAGQHRILRAREFDYLRTP